MGSYALPSHCAFAPVLAVRGQCLSVSRHPDATSVTQVLDITRLQQLQPLFSAAALFTPTASYAQASIAGTVKDTSGAVLPGVTVEAASPALIEKVRTAVTDGTGQYRIEDLRPGTYSGDVHAAGLQHRQARRHRADRVVHRRRSTPI